MAAVIDDEAHAVHSVVGRWDRLHDNLAEVNGLAGPETTHVVDQSQSQRRRAARSVRDVAYTGTWNLRWKMPAQRT